MKRVLLCATLAVVASGGMATSALASGAFGLFYCPHYCDKRCGSCFVATNAFTTTAGCCPGPCAPCGPACTPPTPHPLGACGGDCPGSFGCGGFHYRKTHSHFWHRCKGGDCGVASVGASEHVAPMYHGHPGGPAVLPGPANNVHPTSAAPANVGVGPMQPVAYYGYGMYPNVPMMPTWNAYGYGYYPQMRAGR